MEIIEPQTQDLQVSGTGMVGQANALVIKDDASFMAGGQMLLEIKQRAKNVEERFEDSVSAAHKAHRALTALRDSVLSPFRNAEMTIKAKIGAYQSQVEQARRIEADRVRKELEAQAEKERLAKAEKQMDNGDLNGCKQTLEAPAMPIAVHVEIPEPPKLNGVSFREDWKYEVVDPNLIPREYLMVDESKLRKVVKALGKTAANIPGIRVYAEKVVSAGRQVA